MKKLFTFILASVLLLCLAACGGAATPDPTSPPPPPYVGTWKLSISMEDGSVEKHNLTLGENGAISYYITGTYFDSTVYEEEYSFYDWTEEDYIITCEGGEYTLILLYDAEDDTLINYENQDMVFTRVK